MNNSVSYLTLFKTFLKIGIVTFGGGYAMIPIIESEVIDKHHWMTKEEFLDAIATTQVCPGALAINMSSLLGYKLAKTPGAIVCTLGASLPSFLIILAIAMFFHQFEDNKVVAAMFAGIRPAVVALIAVPTFSLAKSAGKSIRAIFTTMICHTRNFATISPFTSRFYFHNLVTTFITIYNLLS